MNKSPRSQKRAAEELVLLDPDQRAATQRSSIKNYRVSNHLVYVSAIVEKALFFLTYGWIYFQVGLYLDIFCNKNNFNCSVSEKKSSLSRMGSFTFVMCIACNLSYPMMADFNPKVLYNIAKLVFAAGFVLFSFGSLSWMLVGRLLMGGFGEFCHVTGHWMLYQIALPQHKEIAVSFMVTMGAVASVGLTFLSSIDGGGLWTWRFVNASPAALLVFLVFMDITLLNKVNGFNFLQTKMDREGVVNQLSTFYERKTAERVLDEFNMAKAEEGQVELELDLGNEESSKTEEFPAPKKKPMPIIEKFSASSWEVINSSIMGFLCILAFSDMMITGGVYFGSHRLENQLEVTQSKQALFYGSIGFLVTSICVPIFNLSKKRKLFMLGSQLSCSLCILLCAYGYYTEKLWISRMTLIPLAALNGFLYNAFWLYCADLCPPELISIPVACMRLTLAAILYIYPYYFDFEKSSKHRIFWRLIISAGISLVSFGLTCFLMIETDGLTKEEVYMKLRGIVNTRRSGVQDGDERAKNTLFK